MQSKRVTIFVTMIAVVLGSLAVAGATSALRAQPTAVAVADLQGIFNALKEKTAIEAQIKTETEQLQQQEQEKRKAISQMRQDLGVLAPGSDAYKQKENQLKQAAIELQVWTQFQQQQLTSERSIQIESLYRQTVAAIGRIAQDNGYDLVLYTDGAEPDFQYENAQQLAAQIQMRKVLYASNAVNITDQVIQRMNNEYEAGQ